MRQKRFFSTGLFCRFILSYLLVLCLPVAGLFITYLSYARILENEIINMNINALRVVAKNLDSEFSKIDQLINNIAASQTFNTFLNARAPLSAKDRYTAAQLLNEQGSIMNGNAVLQDYFIYFKNSDTVHTATATFDSRLFYDHVFSLPGIDFTAWRAQLRENSVYRNITQEKVQLYAQPREVLVYSQSIPFYHNSQPLAVFEGLIPVDTLESLLNEQVGRGISLIVDLQGRVLVKTSEDFPDRFEFPAEEGGENGVYYYRLDQRQMAVVYTRSSVMNWSYLSVIPQEVFLEKLLAVRNTIYTICVISLFLGLMLAVLFSFQNYTPLGRIGRALSEHGLLGGRIRAGMPSLTESVFKLLNRNDLLEKEIADTKERNREIDRFMAKSRSMLQFSLLNALLDGCIDDYPSFVSWISQDGIVWPHPFYYVILICLADDALFPLPRDNREKYLIKYAVASIVEEIAQKNSPCAATPLEGNQIALVMNLPCKPDIKELRSGVESIFNVCQIIIGQVLHYSIMAGVGGVHSGLERVSVSYAEAKSALQRADPQSQQGCVLYDDIRSESQERYYPLACETQLENYLRAGNLTGCTELLRSIFERGEEGLLPVRYAQMAYEEIQATVSRVLHTLEGVKSLSSQMDMLSRIPPVLEEDTAQALCEKACTRIEGICRAIASDRRGHPVYFINVITNYIRENLDNPLLSQTMIADNFQISTSYLSKFFKKETGCNMVDYINRLRVEKVKELLTKTEKTLDEIAEAVGYGNTKSLIRVFKQYENITPGRYRLQKRS